jgi:hypothetical protein
MTTTNATEIVTTTVTKDHPATPNCFKKRAEGVGVNDRVRVIDEVMVIDTLNDTDADVDGVADFDVVMEGDVVTLLVGVLDVV